MPCQNNGTCIDEINNYRCNCANTGFEGPHCEINIDECAIFGNPCQNNGTCNDLINEYACECHPGYDGINCDRDMPECDGKPCQNQGSCYELSNVQLYGPDSVQLLPIELRQHFDKPFSFDHAEGYVCKCSDGYTGKIFEK